MENRERNEAILKIVCEILEKLGVSVESAFAEDVEGDEGQVLVGIKLDDPSRLIGAYGRNLSALQTVARLAVKKTFGDEVKVVVDVNDYRVEQKERLLRMAKSMADKVKATGQEVVMVPMSSYERRICHMAVAEVEGVVSESEGEGVERHVVIKLG